MWYGTTNYSCLVNIVAPTNEEMLTCRPLGGWRRPLARRAAAGARHGAARRRHARRRVHRWRSAAGHQLQRAALGAACDRAEVSLPFCPRSWFITLAASGPGLNSRHQSQCACLDALQYLGFAPVYVQGVDLAGGRRIARAVSARGGGLPSVEAMALPHGDGARGTPKCVGAESSVAAVAS